MKSKLTTIAVVAAAHFLLLWLSVGILKTSGFALFTLFGPPPRTSSAQEFLFGLVGVLTYPMAWLADLLSVPDNWFTIICGLVVNSGIWGVCVGLLIYGFRQRHQSHAAYHGAVRTRGLKECREPGRRKPGALGCLSLPISPGVGFSTIRPKRAAPFSPVQTRESDVIKR